MATRLYVGNLPFRVTGEDLQELFAAAGEVENASVVTDRETGRSRGFGFVEMATQEGATAAIEQFNGKDYQGRPLTVNEARPRAEGGGGYPIGLVVAPIMPVDGWREHYARLLDDAHAALPAACDLTFELITHRFTPGSKEVLEGWYPNGTLEMDEGARAPKRNKFGGVKYVYPRETMAELRGWFAAALAARLPQAQLLYWT